MTLINAGTALELVGARLIHAQTYLREQDCSGDPETLRLGLGAIIEELDDAIRDLCDASSHLAEHKCTDV